MLWEIWMKDAAEMLQELEAQIQAFNTRRAEAANRKQKAERDVQTSQQEYDALTKAIEGLTPLKSFYAVASVGETIKQAARSGTNRGQIVEILTAHKEPMTIAEIAKIANEEGRLHSSVGYKGIYALVATNLSRNSKHVFIHLNGGKWDLRSRRLNLTPAGSSSRKESAGPATTRGASRFNVFEKILKDFPPAPEGQSGPPMPTALRKMTS
jgi:HB1/ASXL restriction endonuclease-like protein with HTH domain